MSDAQTALMQEALRLRDQINEMLTSAWHLDTPALITSMRQALRVVSKLHATVELAWHDGAKVGRDRGFIDGQNDAIANEQRQ